MNQGVTTGSLIVSLIGEIVWPLTILFLVFMLKDGIISTIQNLFFKRGIKEFRAGGSGVTAIFEADRQETADSKNFSHNSKFLPHGKKYEDIKAKHEENESSYSKQIYEDVKEHIYAFDISDKERIELLLKEVSLLNTSVNCVSIIKILFRSQFELFNKMRDGKNNFKAIEIERYFKEMAIKYPSAFENWDYLKYLSYPISVGLLAYQNGNYQLTNFGEAFVDFMRMNPNLIDDLANL